MTSTSDAVPTTSTEPPHSRAEGSSRSRLRQIVKGVLSAVLVAAIFYFLFGSSMTGLPRTRRHRHLERRA